ncbi:hypothetical protein [Botrimarina hoheduenensis]|uniref:Agarase CBM-like domain-containing protein n=1 Tax=Botrimarina hoheduenensis TaxID=2528000 RepID=A0A5C5VSD4_9BACT|nr:hypothetical protein [Botrimarina hoheduenensis]TWT40671.1 hypothetical protein Pla111_33160 [Botrimarina hoheduenensis]
MTNRFLVPTVFLVTVSVLVLPVAAEEAAIAVHSFEESTLPTGVEVVAASARLTHDGGVTDGRQALAVTLPIDTGWSGIRITPDEPWDVSELGDCRFSFDAASTGPTSINLQCVVTSANGGSVRRMTAVPVGKTKTYYYPLSGPDIGEGSGLRDDPPSLDGVGTKLVTNNPRYKVDYSRIKSIEFYVQDTADEDTLVIDNLRFVSNPPINEDYLTNLVDQFGQNAKCDFEQKVHSEEELKRIAKEELAELASEGPMPDRSRFGGWKSGPRFEATGYFRPQKLGDRWALVDPEGYLYFATGIANARMANTSTFTGVDFKDESVRYRDPEEVTPEDSLGIVPSSDEARRTSYIAYDYRRRLFEWLPVYSDPLAKYYGYRRSAHIGPTPHGEVFSFYLANLERRYGLPESGDIQETWRAITTDRMLNWGFTCLGNWADAAFYEEHRIPFFANGWIIGDFKTLSGGYWGAMPDVFDPEFKRRAEVTTKVVADEVKDSPWCVGVFIDNEKAWGNTESTRKRYGIVLHALTLGAADSPAKAAFVETLKRKYTTIEEFNEAWNKQFNSWGEFASGYEWEDGDEGSKLLADLSLLSEQYAEQYFRIVHNALQSELPNHQYLGCRLTPWGGTPEVWKAASKFCDVMSFNFYHEAIGERNWKFLPMIDRPTIIGEWHIGSTDSGLPNPGLIHAVDQNDRAEMYKKYMRSVVENPYLVGAHWFQYIDSPLTGRAHDGENYNVGFVNVADVPYKPMVEAAKLINRGLYPDAYGKAVSKFPPSQPD